MGETAARTIGNMRANPHNLDEHRRLVDAQTLAFLRQSLHHYEEQLRAMRALVAAS